MPRTETCAYWPRKTVIWDDDDNEYDAYNLYCDEDDYDGNMWKCDQCGEELMSGWFEQGTGKSYAKYCPFCGCEIVQDLDKLQERTLLE